jgi:inner membrane protein
MDPVTHSLTGAALSRAGLNRTTPLATATLVIAANAPDVDIAAMAWGSYGSLALRRGITHGPLALLLLPLVVTGAVMLYDRGWRRRKRPESAAVRPLAVLALAALGVLTHPALDWLNTYGIRLLMPFSDRWFYGDSLFIIDPWVWLALAAPLVGMYARGRRGTMLWVALGIAAAATVTLAPGVPLLARIIWLAAAAALLAHVVAGRRRERRESAVVGIDTERAGGRAARRAAPAGSAAPSAPAGSSAPSGRQGARLAVAAVAAYILLMVLSDVAGRSRVLSEATSAGITVDDMMLAPVPANPFGGEVVIAAGAAYYLGSFDWLRRPHVRWGAQIPMGTRDEVVLATLQLQQVRDFLRWSRFPFVEVSESADGYVVRFGDARYPGMMRGGLGGITVQVERSLRAAPQR